MDTSVIVPLEYAQKDPSKSVGVGCGVELGSGVGILCVIEGVLAGV